MSKDLLIAGAIVVTCITATALAVVAPGGAATSGGDAPAIAREDTPPPPPSVGIDRPSPPVDDTPNSQPPLDMPPPLTARGEDPGRPRGPAWFPGVTPLPPAQQQPDRAPPMNAGGPGTPLKPETADTPQDPTATRVHTVAAGETLGDISLKYYGTSRPWRQIQAANPGVDPGSLHVGQKLTIPPLPREAPKPADAHVPAAGDGRTYTVRSGDSYYAIAQRELGDATRYQELEKLNGISRDDLRPGLVIKLPERKAAVEKPSKPAAPADDAPIPGNVHVVRAGDTLQDISKQHFGTTRHWRKIKDANPSLDPDNLKVGQRVVLPDIPAEARGPATPVADPAAPGADIPGTDYVIKAGDNLHSIAHGDTALMERIRQANPGVDPKHLRIGQKLRIPGGTNAAPTPTPAPRPSPVERADVFLPHDDLPPAPSIPRSSSPAPAPAPVWPTLPRDAAPETAPTWPAPSSATTPSSSAPPTSSAPAGGNSTFSADDMLREVSGPQR